MPIRLAAQTAFLASSTTVIRQRWSRCESASREAMIAATNSYFDAIISHDGKIVQAMR